MATQLNIIVVEDHDALREVTVNALRHKGHHVIGLDSAEALPEQKDIGSIDMMLIDINLPGESGLSLTQRIRHIYPDIGIIIISANQLANHKMQGYDCGADIYLTKPASLEEISAAIQALSRRLKPQATESLGIKLHLQSLTLKKHERSVTINQHESMLLLALLRTPEHRLETWQLLELLSHDQLEYSKASLEVLIVRLRKKLVSLDSTVGNPIRSIRNYGYQLCEPMTIID
ncbi:response regulator transcription factor [Methylobacillus gramineus]|uniref:response regulator transcription factor n=1 Tax=Methylobacillus gramineus TaxID=755169 RepID=UPI001CFFEDCF|nr:response regulator transcription factor [Methylobacillus gramineus]MCB5185901.1 response regulator transcription factor [Methylobacillus gramineus]